MAATIVRSGMVRTRIPGAPRPAPSLFSMPGLGTQPWWERAGLPWVGPLERAHDIFAEEYLALRRANPRSSDYDLKDGESKLHSGNWDWQSFVQKGRWQAEMVAHCPRSIEVLRSLPDLMTDIPLAYCFFSTLGPGSRIAPHYGPSNLRVRCHLPLAVPPDTSVDTCGIRVGDEARPWREGEALVFDDAFEHETWNLHATASRVVLLVDFWHPDLLHSERQALQEMFASTN